MLESCSVETRWRRFGHVTSAVTDEAAARYCFVDYDREIAIVAETQEQPKRLVGVGRLVAGAGRKSAEVAFLVVDDWQGKGVGTILAEYCLEVARQWGFKRLSASTSADNCRMLRIFRRMGFDLNDISEPGFVLASKPIG
jgi:acetyltransferase